MKITTISRPFRPNAAAAKLLPASSILLLLAVSLLPLQLFCQPVSSALVELESTNQGFLLPRLTQTQRDSIANPATGLMIFNITSRHLEVNVGSPSTPYWRSPDCLGYIAGLNCAGATVTGAAIPYHPVSGVVISVPYADGNGGGHAGQSLNSTGVTNLTATLAVGDFAHGAGSLQYVISGTPAGAGTAGFALDIGGQSCTLNLSVACGAYVAPNVWKNFLCHNLGAVNTAADPMQPGWEVNGGYWQWGRPGPSSSQWLNTNTANFAHGPGGPGAGQANEAAISGWSTTAAPDGSWTDATKTANDPCPMGYRVPTKAQWDGVLAHNAQGITGAWASGPFNYSSGRLFGSSLMLPAAGYRSGNNGGALFSRGSSGDYWSSTEIFPGSWGLNFFSESVSLGNTTRRDGLSLRCVEE
jgi:hypothetical protein